jgi:ubiquinol-cytochrome c reductase cytochrome b subunit
MQWTSTLKDWLDSRFPITEMWNRHAAKYYAPKNFNFWYFFGIFSTVVFINQIITGIWLSMFYVPTSAEAFSSVEEIMRHVKFGWLFRYMHSTGASAFFIVIYLHMYRGIMYGSFKKPRELVWLIGMLIYAVLLMESASGYILPWGQMSYWATKVLASLLTVVPFIGKSLAILVQGDYNVSGVTLHRFFSLHVIVFPMILGFLVWAHLMALHEVGSNNPDGIDIKKYKNAEGQPLDGVPFHPYYTVKDFFGVIIFLIIFFVAVFYFPTMGGFFLESANFAPANPLVTPLHIAPPWYMAPFYSILRAIPNKYFGVTMASAAVAALFVLPWLDRSKVRSIRYRGPWTKIALTIFVISFLTLGYLGTEPLTDSNIISSRIFTVLYFAFFIAMPFYTKYETTKPVPDRVSYH